MDSESNDVPEDGEIVDYEPNPRPSVASGMKPNDSFRSIERDSHTSDSSDSEEGRISHLKPKINRNDKSRNKYNVWASEFQASELMDEICNWETGLKNSVLDKSRDVESYYHLPEEGNLANPNEKDVRKRRHDEVVDLRTKLGRKQNKRNDDPLSRPRYLSELRVTLNDSVDDITQDITSKLCEEKEDLVLRAVTVLGKQKAINIFQKTKDLEESGGMMVMNGSRRRTPGGVFLQLIKKDEELTKEEKNKIFIDDQRTGFKGKKSQAKQIQKKRSDLQMPMLDNAEDERLPSLLTRKEIALTAEHPIGDCGPITDVSPAIDPAEKHKREMTVYEEEDLFDDSPCDEEFT